MSYPELKQGATDLAEVKRLQSLLNRVGAMLKVDGDFGRGTVGGVRHAQQLAGLPETGVVTEPLWKWLEAQPEPFPRLPTDGVAYIAAEETGGRAYYELHARLPHYPGGESGITLGVGYDLRMNTLENFRQVWQQHLRPPMCAELEKDIRRRGTARRAGELAAMGFEVPFATAWRVFVGDSMPRFYAETARCYPCLDTLPGPCRTALVSLVYNRGSSTKGDARREMKAIQDLLRQAERAGTQRKEVLAEVEQQFLDMKRLWNSSSGLIKRRQAEANLWREGIATLV